MSSCYVIKKHFTHIALSIALFSIQSCKTLVAPATVSPVPLFSESGDIWGNGSFGKNGANLQLGVSPFQNLAVLGTVNFIKTENYNISNNDIAIGLYKNNDDFPMCAEFFVGIGQFNVNILSSQILIKSGTYSFNKFYFQPNFGFKTNNFHIAFSPRYTTYGSLNKKIIFFEPSLTAKYGWKKFKFFTQVGGNFIIKNSPVNYNETMVFAFGVDVKLKAKNLFSNKTNL